jgi:ComF family protein
MNLREVYDDRARWARLPAWPCELCGAPTGQAGICPPCHADLPWLGPACLACAHPRRVPGLCERCQRRPPPWRRAIVPLAWAFPVDALIGRFKYGGALHYGALLGRLLAAAAAAAAAAACAERRPDAIVPMPLHRARLAERGFNQARELARPVGRAVGVPVLDTLCSRPRATPPQAGLTARQRYRNLRGAFAVTPAARGLRLAILDDVLTTGSTALALSRELLHAGAASIEIWAVARGGTGHAPAGAKV